MRQLIRGKTVWVLGAGASYHCGSPLLRDFLVRARSLMYGNKQLVHKESFKNLFSWLDQQRASSYFINVDLDNLEHVFSIIVTMKQLKQGEGESLFKDISWVIFETLDQECQLELKRTSYPPSAIYNEFVSGIVQRLNSDKENFLEPEERDSSRDSIVTFNYDVMLDYAFRWNKMKINYCLKEDTDKRTWKFLKLHGSMNWGIHDGCLEQRDPKIINAEPKTENFPVDRLPPQMAFRIVTDMLLSTPCKCGKREVLHPLFIPPIWSKNPDHPSIQNVWRQAIQEIESAFQLVIIGYSMPTTDTFFPYLLSLALSKNTRFYRVVVINKDASEEEFKNRYRSIFSRGFVERNRLIFEANKFEELVHPSDIVSPNKIEELIKYYES